MELVYKIETGLKNGTAIFFYQEFEKRTENCFSTRKFLTTANKEKNWLIFKNLTFKTELLNTFYFRSFLLQTSISVFSKINRFKLTTYLGYQGRIEEHGGVLSGVLGVPKVPRGRVRKPGRWVSGVPRVSGQEGR